MFTVILVLYNNVCNFSRALNKPENLLGQVLVIGKGQEAPIASLRLGTH